MALALKDRIGYGYVRVRGANIQFILADLKGLALFKKLVNLKVHGYNRIPLGLQVNLAPLVNRGYWMSGFFFGLWRN